MKVIDPQFKIQEPKLVDEFIKAGRAIFTIESKKTGKWFTYKVVAPKEQKPERPVWFVKLMTGTDNESSYSYLGTIFSKEFKHTSKSRITPDAIGYKAFDFFFKKLESGELHPEINFYHMGNCGRCGRTLTTPESVSRGIGPICNGIH